MPEFMLEHLRSLSPEWQLRLLFLYLAIGFFAGAMLHGYLWRFAKENPPSTDDSPTTRILKTSLTRWTGLMIGFFFWPFVPFMYVGGKLLSQFLVWRNERSKTRPKQD